MMLSSIFLKFPIVLNNSYLNIRFKHNKEKYLEQYRKALGNYNIDITFINEQT